MTYREELLRTPDILRRVMKEKAEPCLENADKVIFCGCGTSFYMGQQIANIMNAAGKHAGAIEAICLIENPPVTKKGEVYVFISRSGNSMETVLAMREAKKAGAETFYLGCKPGSKLQVECDGARVIEYGEESLILESYSFYAQFLLACVCCGLTCREDLPETVEKAFLMADDCFEKLYAPGTIRRIICLGAPFYMPLLREMMLKNGEITLLPVENWGILEFRHGPRSWADESTLIQMVPGVKSADWDKHVGEELISYGCPVIYISGNELSGAYLADMKAEPYSIEEALAVSAFITAFAVRIGQALKTTPEQIKHVVHNVGGL